MLFSSTILLAAAFLTPHVAAAKNFQAKVSTPAAFQAASPNSVTSNVLTLNKKASAKGYNPRSAAWLTNKPGTIPTGHSTTLISLFIGEEFATTITFGTETFESIVDTGSSDTWIVETGFKCVNVSNSAPLPEADCYFGPTYNVTDTFKQASFQSLVYCFHVLRVLGSPDMSQANDSCLLRHCHNPKFLPQGTTDSKNLTDS